MRTRSTRYALMCIMLFSFPFIFFILFIFFIHTYFTFNCIRDHAKTLASDSRSWQSSFTSLSREKTREKISKRFVRVLSSYRRMTWRFTHNRMQTIAARLECGSPPRLRRYANLQFPVKWSANIRPLLHVCVHNAGSFKVRAWHARDSVVTNSARPQYLSGYLIFRQLNEFRQNHHL